MRKVIKGSWVLAAAVIAIVSAARVDSKTGPAQFAEDPATPRRPLIQVAVAEDPATPRRPLIQVAVAEDPATPRRP